VVLALGGRRLPRRAGGDHGPDPEARLSFRLVKWYGDLTTETGDAVILYAANLEAPIALRYAARLEAAGTRSRFSHSLDASRITQHEDSWSWRAPGLAARFRALQRSVPIDLLEDLWPGAVRWHAVAPLCEARIEVENRSFEGLGYLERLELAVPPWQLPLGRLVWGRFVHAQAGLVWIDWEGPHRLTIVLRDGARIEGTIEPDRVCAAGMQLEIGERQVLREGTLGRVALAGISALSRIAPVEFLRTTERKTLSRGRLTRGNEVLEGWIIDEVVTWEH